MVVSFDLQLFEQRKDCPTSIDCGAEFHEAFGIVDAHVKNGAAGLSIDLDFAHVFVK